MGNNGSDYKYMIGNNNPAKRKEVKQKISISLKNRKITWGDKISVSLKNSEKTKATLKKACIKAQFANKGRVPWNKGLNKYNDDRMKQISKNRKGKLMGEENPSKRVSVRNKISKKIKAKYDSGAIFGFKVLSHEDRIKIWKKSISVQSKSKISKAEKEVAKFLKIKKIKFISQYVYNLGIADFYLPKHNVIIQCYGSYWHSKPDYIKRDKRQNEWLLKNGYTVYILNSEQILKYGVERIASEFVPFYE